jgi:hypothetical protein
VWAKGELRLLVKLYPHRSTKEIAERLNRSLWKVYAKANALGLKKTAGYIQDPKNRCRLFRGHKYGQSTQFPKGHVPANLGLRRPGYAPGRMKETQFKKGERSGVAARNWKPVGTIMPDSEGYLRIKVREAVYGEEATGFGNPKVWPLYNRYLWEQTHGPIPPKHLVAFKDGKRANCVIENLELRSMTDNARRNVMWNNLPRELAEAIQAQGALKRKLRKLGGEEQDNRSPGSPVRDAGSA